MLRIVVAPAAPDGQDHGAERLARLLRDAGHEVIYTGPDPSDEQVVATAVQEDADLVALPASGESRADRIRALLADAGAEDIGLREFTATTTASEISGDA